MITTERSSSHYPDSWCILLLNLGHRAMALFIRVVGMDKVSRQTRLIFGIIFVICSPGSDKPRTTVCELA